MYEMPAHWFKKQQIQSPITVHLVLIAHLCFTNVALADSDDPEINEGVDNKNITVLSVEYESTNGNLLPETVATNRKRTKGALALN